MYNSFAGQHSIFAVKKIMKLTFLYLSIVIASGAMLTNIYTSIVDVVSWGSDIPHSIEVARQYFKASDPGNYFRVFSPMNQLLGLISLVIFWKSGKNIRLLLIAALICYLVAEGMTFLFFYPRNDIMFFNEGRPGAEELKMVWQQWSSMNWVRTLVVAAGLTCSSLALHRIYLNGKR